MAIPISNDEEVYRHYLDCFGLDGDGDPNAIALFTYALVEKDKYEWMSHYRNLNNNAMPSAVEIEKWFINKPESYFDEKSKLAMNWYRAFARSLLAEEIEDAKRDAIKEYIGEKLKFWPQLGQSLASNIIFIILLGALAAYVAADFSPIAWMREHVFHSAVPY